MSGGICGPQIASKRYFPFRDNNLRAHASPCPNCRQVKTYDAADSKRAWHRRQAGLSADRRALQRNGIQRMGPHLSLRHVREGSSASFELP
jgi:hypothetical protein